jgi:transcriptional regulator with XRE-family HTH domain
MPDSINTLPPDIGQTLSELRKAAGRTQTYIEERLKEQGLNVDQTRVSRIEKGLVTPTEGEIEGYLSTIGTDEAKAYRELLNQPWEILERPPFRHPQRDVLCKAEVALQWVKDFKSQPVPDFLKSRVQKYEDRLLREAKYLTSLKHPIAYVGKIGIGKTTAVCKLAGLVVPQAASFERQSGLATGSGGTTVCEVHIRRAEKFRAEKFGILLEPQSKEEIEKLIEDYWASWKSSTEGEQKNQQRDVSSEITRTLRNMTGLARVSREGANGKKEKFDELVDLVNKCADLEAFRVEILDRMKLQERTQREFWCQETSPSAGLEWLKKTFEDINYVRNKELPLPERIDVFVPDQVFPSSPYELEIVDTKGIDGTAIRQDLKRYQIDDPPRALTVLCSGFNDAPDLAIQSLIDNLIETGSKEVLEKRVILLVLPRPDEALATKDDAGYEVDTEEEGYELKHDRVLETLQQKCTEASNVPILFFNAQSKQDDPAQINKALIQRIEKLREPHVERLKNAIEGIDGLIQHQEDEAHQDVRDALKRFVKRHQNDLASVQWSVHEYLLAQMNYEHPSRIRAAMRNGGTWKNLDVYFLLGEGARAVAWSHTQQAFNGLKEQLKDLLDEHKQKPAIQNFLREILASWDEWREDFLKFAQLAGEQKFSPQLKYSDIWAQCADIKGSGFRDRVILRLRYWFNAPEQRNLQNLLKDPMEKAWQEKVLAQLEKLTDDGVEADKAALSKQ